MSYVFDDVLKRMIVCRMFLDLSYVFICIRMYAGKKYAL